MLYVCIYVAPWSCEARHFVPLYVPTCSGMTIKLNLNLNLNLKQRMFLDLHNYWSWNHIPINQSDFRIRLRTGVGAFKNNPNSSWFLPVQGVLDLNMLWMWLCRTRPWTTATMELEGRFHCHFSSQSSLTLLDYLCAPGDSNGLSGDASANAWPWSLCSFWVSDPHQREWWCFNGGRRDAQTLMSFRQV